MNALEGVRVLDLGRNVSAPYCAKLFGSFGAEVIKVEKPGTGDSARSAGPFLDDRPHPETSALFLYLNTNKKGITLNLRTQTGAEIFRGLVEDADVLVENFPPGFMSGLGLGYETLDRVNPLLVMASILLSARCLLLILSSSRVPSRSKRMNSASSFSSLTISVGNSSQP